MKLKIEDGPPVSGTIVEHWFDASGICTWVIFGSDTDSPWAGVFGNRGDRGRALAVAFGKAPYALVVAGGQGYVVDPAAQKLRYRTRSSSLIDAVAVPGRDLVIATDGWRLTVLGEQGEVWESEHLAMDGIEFVEAGHDHLVGRANHHDGWKQFTLHYEGWHLDPTGFRWPPNVNRGAV